MANFAKSSFETRSRRIVRDRRAIALGGGVDHFDHTGLLTVRPRRGGVRFPARGLLILLAVFLAAKVAMLTADGSLAYGARVAALASGDAVARAGAWAMQADPLSIYLSDELRALLRSVSG